MRPSSPQRSYRGLERDASNRSRPDPYHPRTDAKLSTSATWGAMLRPTPPGSSQRNNDPSPHLSPPQSSCPLATLQPRLSPPTPTNTHSLSRTITTSASTQAQKTLELGFVQMSEISISDEPPQAPGHPLAHDISQWTEQSSLMAAVLPTQFPEKAPELWNVRQQLYGQSETMKEGNRKVTYDRQYKRQALAKKDLNWSPSSVTTRHSRGVHAPSMLLQLAR